MKQPITFAIWNRPPPEMGWPHDRVLSWAKQRILIGTLAPVSLSNAFSISKAQCCNLCCDLVLVALEVLVALAVDRAPIYALHRKRLSHQICFSLPSLHSPPDFALSNKMHYALVALAVPLALALLVALASAQSCGYPAFPPIECTEHCCTDK